MAFEKILKAIESYNEILRADEIIDEGHLASVLKVMFVDIQNEVSTGSTSLPEGGIPGQVLTKATDDEGGAVWADSSSSGGDFLPLTGGIMEGDLFMENNNINATIITSDLIEMSFDSGTITSQTSSGISYSDDYSANYTDRTLVDKAYVDTSINDFNSTYLTVDGSNSMQNPLVMSGFDITDIGSLQLSSGGTINLQNLDNFNVWSANNGDTYIDLNSLEVYNSGGLPINYSGDYSLNYTDRSLVDKAYVDQAIAAAIAALP